MALPILGCEPPIPPEHSGRPLVVATIFPLGDLVKTLAGPEVDVEVLLPPRASPDTWEATPKQIRLLGRARARVAVGAGLDDWLDGLAPPGLPVSRIAEGVKLVEATEDRHGHGHAGDPHVWLDPVLVRDRVVPALADFLAAVVPDVGGIPARAQALQDSLTLLDRETSEALSGAPVRAFVATHGGWIYFARRYGLTPLGSLYERPGHEPSARGLAHLVDAARAAGVRVVLSEPQMPAAAARALAGELEGRVVSVDPLGGRGLDGRDGYLALMRFNARAFAEALGATAAPPSATAPPTAIVGAR